MQHISKEKEVKSLRQQLLDFQVQSDEKTIIGMPQYLSGYYSLLAELLYCVLE